MSERVTREQKNNLVRLSGIINTNFTYSHTVMREEFYCAKIVVPRLSGTMDTIKVMASKVLVDGKGFTNKIVEISGEFRSYNIKDEQGNSHLDLFVFISEIESCEASGKNNIFLDGYICKEPKYRQTPLGKNITDLIIAVNRPYEKSDYIPCIAWGRNALLASELKVGNRVQLEGRIQSRNYTKISEDEVKKIMVATEVSIMGLSKLL